MITDAGSNAIGRFIAANLHSYIAVGIGGTEPSAADKQLQFEVARAEVNNASYDAATGVITFKATLPSEVELSISELALLTADSINPYSGILSSFDSSDDEWTGGTWVTNNSRVGNDALNVALGTASTNNMRTYTSKIGNSDVLQVAYYGAGGTAEVRLNNTDVDYLSFTFPVATGPAVAGVKVADMTRTGDVSLDSINGITVVHSGSGSVTMEAIRFARVDDEEIMIVRQTLNETYEKVAGVPMDIEIPVMI